MNQESVGEARVKYLKEVEGGILESGQSAASDEHIGIHGQLLIPHLDGGQLDANPVNAGAELLQEALVVLLGDPEQAVDDLLALHEAQVADVELFVDDAAAQLLLQNGGVQAVNGGQLLQRRPLERLLVIDLVSPRRCGVPPEHIVGPEAPVARGAPKRPPRPPAAPQVLHHPVQRR